MRILKALRGIAVAVCSPIARRPLVSLLAGGVLLLTALATAPWADAATIYVCVKKSNGAMRLVSKSTKCKHGETKLSWNTEGPAGKNGTNGVNGLGGKEGKQGNEGKAGANGAVAGFSAALEEPVLLPEVVLAKTLPAGHYLISAKADLFGLATTTGKIGLGCELYVEGGAALDEARALVPLLKLASPGKYGARTTLSTQAAVTLSSSATIVLYCISSEEEGTIEKIVAFEGRLDALQVNSLS